MIERTPTVCAVVTTYAPNGMEDQRLMEFSTTDHADAAKQAAKIVRTQMVRDIRTFDGPGKTFTMDDPSVTEA